MNDDDRQEGALRCLKAGYGLDALNPYSGKIFLAAQRTARIDRIRREKSDRRRNENRERLCPAERYARCCDDPVWNAELHETTELLVKFIDEMPQEQGSIIRKCDLQGATLRHYAAETGMSQSKIR